MRLTDIEATLATEVQQYIPDLSAGVPTPQAETVPWLFDPESPPEWGYTLRQAVRDAARPHKGGWAIMDSRLRDYELTFASVLDDTSGSIASFIPDRQEGRAEPVVAVDIMAGTAALRDLRSQVLSRSSPSRPVDFRGFAVGMNDPRSPQQKAMDTANGISLVFGNIRNPATWDRLEEKMGGLKADLVMERAVGGVRAIPKHPAYFEAGLRRVWCITRLGGTMLLELPGVREFRYPGLNLQGMVDNLRAQGVEAQQKAELMNSVVRLRRTF